jgi:hypothetical protein
LGLLIDKQTHINVYICLHNAEPTTLTWILSGELRVLTLALLTWIQSGEFLQPASVRRWPCFRPWFRRVLLPRHSPGYYPVRSCFGISHAPAYFVPWVFDAFLLPRHSPGYYPVSSCFGISHAPAYFVPWVFDAVLLPQHSPGYYPVSSSHRPPISQTFVSWVFLTRSIDHLVLSAFLHYSAQRFAYFSTETILGNNPLVCKPLFNHQSYSPLIQSDIRASSTRGSLRRRPLISDVSEASTL